MRRRLIFVTVGSSNFGFDRLIKTMDLIAGTGNFNVIMQIGSSSYIPRHGKWERFMDYNLILQYISEADVTVTHAGAGTILDILFTGKIPVVVPRLKRYNEATDDHQLELVKALEKRDLIIPVYDIRNLGEAILTGLEVNSDRHRMKIIKLTKNRSRLARILGEILCR